MAKTFVGIAKLPAELGLGGWVAVGITHDEQEPPILKTGSLREILVAAMKSDPWTIVVDHWVFVEAHDQFVHLGFDKSKLIATRCGYSQLSQATTKALERLSFDYIEDGAGNVKPRKLNSADGALVFAFKGMLDSRAQIHLAFQS